MMLQQYLLYTLLLPLLGFVMNGVMYKQKNKLLISFIGCGVVLLSFVFGVMLFNSVDKDSYRFQFDYFDFLQLNSLKISFSLMIDRLNAIYVLIITGIGFLIHIYSIGYMHHDEGFAKYFAYLNLFVFSMLLLVLGANYLILFIGWEGVGLCSFLLIGFWNNNKSYTYAARKAFVMNRVGDLCFLLALFLLLLEFKTLDFYIIQDNAGQLKENGSLIVAITLLMFAGATGKSAQIPLFTWLPDAMAGPTPVSALIHAATMVTAGIFLVARSHFLFDLASLSKSIILIVGLVTAFVAATIACFQKDIKKVLAYSTVSQLGFMFMSLGVGNYIGAVFHVMTHAFFKALLFLGAGSVIHAMGGEQNMDSMGGLKKRLPITHATMLVATLAITGVPGFAGFFSKDAILMSVFNYHVYYYVVALFVALLTAFYMFRMYFLTFYGTFRGTIDQQNHLHESPLSMTLPLMVLAVLSLLGGYVNLPQIFGGGVRLEHFLFAILPHYEGHLDHGVEIGLMVMTFVLVLGIMFWTKRKFSLTTTSIQGTSGLNFFIFLKKNGL